MKFFIMTFSFSLTLANFAYSSNGEAAEKNYQTYQEDIQKCDALNTPAEKDQCVAIAAGKGLCDYLSSFDRKRECFGFVYTDNIVKKCAEKYQEEARRKKCAIDEVGKYIKAGWRFDGFPYTFKLDS